MTTASGRETRKCGHVTAITGRLKSQISEIMNIRGLNILSFIICLFGCHGFNKAGNRIPMLDLSIKTNVNQKVIMSYLDSVGSRDSGRFAMPARYDFLRNGGDLEYFPEKNKIAYFNNSPIEAYHLSSNGGFFLAEVYNPLMAPDWITEKQRLINSDYIRIERRIDTLLQVIVKDARLRGSPDTTIFWDKPYNRVVCTLNKP